MHCAACTTARSAAILVFQSRSLPRFCAFSEKPSLTEITESSMVNLSSTSDPASSVQPSDGEGVKAEEWPEMDKEGIPVDLAKRFFELQALNDRTKEENQRLSARNLVLEEMFREHRRLLEDKEELVIRLQEDAVSTSEMERRLNEKYERLNDRYQRLRGRFESEERKWKEEVAKVEEKRWQLEVEKRKLEVDLQDARRAENGSCDVVAKTKAVEEMKRILEEKKVKISELVRKNRELEREKVKLEEELGERVIELEEAVARWVAEKNFPMLADTAAVACNIQANGIEDLQTSDPKSGHISLIQPKKENPEADVLLKGPGIGPELSYARKSTASLIVQISDDKEEEEGEEEEKQSSSVASIPTAKFPQKRKVEAVTHSPKEEGKTKMLKCNGGKDCKIWETADKMFNAFTTNSNLCMKSVCALYRKNKSLGVWKNLSAGNNVFKPLAIRGISLGQLLTGGDPEGRLKKTVADLEREDPLGIDDCRLIARQHYKELFEIYSNNTDPLFFYPD